MKKLLIIALLALTSCSTIKYVPIQGETIVKEIVRDSIIYVDVPREVIKECVPELDTLVMETEFAMSVTYLDTNVRVLKGTLENKEHKIEKEIQYVVRENIVTNEVPVEVEVVKYKYPTSYWIFLGITILCALYIGIKIYLKIKL